ncbi:MAG: ATP-binding cassette domain-containing protein [Planctomycetota bacterium]|nr:ATP-binding cassette domain-containing protein [Planctomycetota bacterium]MDA1177269.1 ATP-binding cassette domain-containing protein [Planctomycetota bacterium]
MALATLQNVSIGYRGPLLLDDVNCQIEVDQRIGLVGRNGAGKTTLMRLLCREIVPDHGTVEIAADAHVAWLPQDVPRDLTGTVEDVVMQGLPAGWRDSETPWVYEQQVEKILEQMDLSPDRLIETESSGRKRRVLLARALASQPQLLLLDEPTNHLDLPSIQWLEEFLLHRWRGTLLFVTHDRVFLQNIATRILEIDRGRIFDWTCDYATFLKRKAAALEAEEKQVALFSKRLSEEEAWIRQGVKARRTRNEGRVRALKSMREEWATRQKNPQAVRLQIQSGQRSGNLIADVQEISFAYEQQPIVHNFSTLIMRGDKIGIIGPNGAGKTTLLRLLLGQLEPQAGRVRLGTNLQIAYFDQLREQLREDSTVQENVGDGYDTVEFGGRSQHVLGYLQNFLFTPERARTLVKFLSGGERNRVLLAKLFAKSANVIVLDEPTNDLDTETLELLEEQLIQFDGTVLVVSHDRAFLNQVATSTIVFEGGNIREFVGGYDDWQRQKAQADTVEATVQQPREKARGKKPPLTTTRGQKRLSHSDRLELKSLPAKIESMESLVAETHRKMALPGFYQQDKDQILAVQEELKRVQQELAGTYSRWEALDALAKL